MRIAIFTDTFTPQINGVVTSTLTFRRVLEALGHEVLVAGPKLKGGPDSSPREWRFRSIPFPFQKEHCLISPLSRHLRHFDDNQFDIIHVQTPFSMGHLGQYLGWRYNIPVVHTYHTYWEEYLHYFPILPQKLRKKLYIHLLSKTFCNRSDHVVVPSSQMRDKLLTYDITTPMTIIPTGISTTIHVTDDDRAQFMVQHNLSTQTRYLIFVGRLGLEKNIYFVLDAFAKIAAQLGDVNLIIAGDGPERDGLVAHATSLGIVNRCHFLGYIEHAAVFTAYSVSTVIVFASKTETQGLSLLEGLSVGRPAVCLDASGVSDILANDRGGFLTQENAEVFASTCVRLLSDPVLYAAKAADAYQRASDFSDENMTVRLLDVYAQTIAHYHPTKRRSFDD